MSTSSLQASHPRSQNLKRIADDTIEAIKRGSFELNNVTYDLRAPVDALRRSTEYYAPNSLLSTWANHALKSSTTTSTTDVSILEISTLDGARYLHTQTSEKIGILNFASAKKPGGGFLSGAQAQEESIARSSTLYYSLTTRTGDDFYKLHKKDPNNGYYSHAMIYSPAVTIFRDDVGAWVKPLIADVLTSPAVNAGDVRRRLSWATPSAALEKKIEAEMRERMGRILYLFKSKGVKCLVLGSFGTGVFKNNIDVVARLWAELLTVRGAPFEGTFDRILFAILGKNTITQFEKTFLACNA